MPKVLIADDREENRFVLINFFKLLGPDSNIEIIESDNSLDAIKKIEQHLPELILMDIKMETNDAGLSATRQLKENDKTKHIPIWAITAQAMEAHDNEDSDRVKCLKAGCDDYISKPFDPIELLVKASKVLKIEIPENIKSKMGI